MKLTKMQQELLLKQREEIDLREYNLRAKETALSVTAKIYATTAIGEINQFLIDSEKIFKWLTQVDNTSPTIK